MKKKAPDQRLEDVLQALRHNRQIPARPTRLVRSRAKALALVEFRAADFCCLVGSHDPTHTLSVDTFNKGIALMDAVLLLLLDYVHGDTPSPVPDNANA